jgi:hypothetical protein
MPADASNSFKGALPFVVVDISTADRFETHRYRTRPATGDVRGVLAAALDGCSPRIMLAA